MRHSLGALVTLSLPDPAGVKALLDMLAGHILEPERPTSWPRHEVPLLRSCHPSGLGATSPGNALYFHWPYLPLNLIFSSSAPSVSYEDEISGGESISKMVNFTYM